MAMIINWPHNPYMEWNREESYEVMGALRAHAANPRRPSYGPKVERSIRTYFGASLHYRFVSTHLYPTFITRFVGLMASAQEKAAFQWI